MHEASLFDQNSFITLTYSDKFLPSDRGLHYRDFQLFMKRLRKDRKGVRFYMCGEYGDLLGRPHFHACLFNCGFIDRYYWRMSNGSRLYRSPTLEKLWKFGDSTIGDVTFESAAYCARYVMKKLTGDGEKDYYNIFDVSTGEIFVRSKEFCHMSLKPGIGSDWLRLFWQDCHDGKVVVNGHKAALPRYYKKYFARSDIGKNLRYDNEELAYERRDDNIPERLAVREQVVKAQVNILKRSLGE